MTSTTPAAVAHERGSGELSHRQILTILSGLMAGMFLAALDQTIVATSIRTIADDLQGLSVQAWVTTAYLVTATISTPLYGKLSDLYGRRPFFLLAISVFVLGSALSGFATSMGQLAAFRAFQGLGAGGLFSLALTIIGDIVPPRERAKYQGYFLAVFGTSSVLGPVVGGFLAGQDTLLGITGWRWVFLVNVPIGIFALLLVMRSLHLPHTRREHRIDWPGALLLIVGLVPLLVIAEQGREWGWGSGRALVSYVIGAVGIAGFICGPGSLRRRRTDPAAPVPRQDLRHRLGHELHPRHGHVRWSGGAAALPADRQGLLADRGRPAAAPADGRHHERLDPLRPDHQPDRALQEVPRHRHRLLLLALLGLSRVGIDTSVGVTLGLAFVFGVGLGFNMQPLVLAVQNAVPPQDMGVATSSATFFRQMGGTLGTAVFLSVLFSSVGGKITSAFQAASGTADFRAALSDPKSRPTRSTARSSRPSRPVPACRRAPSTTRRSCRARRPAGEAVPRRVLLGDRPGLPVGGGRAPGGLRGGLLPP